MCRHSEPPRQQHHFPIRRSQPPCSVVFYSTETFLSKAHCRTIRHWLFIFILWQMMMFTPMSIHFNPCFVGFVAAIPVQACNCAPCLRISTVERVESRQKALDSLCQNMMKGVTECAWVRLSCPLQLNKFSVITPFLSVSPYHTQILDPFFMMPLYTYT